MVDACVIVAPRGRDGLNWSGLAKAAAKPATKSERSMRSLSAQPEIGSTRLRERHGACQISALGYRWSASDSLGEPHDARGASHDDVRME